jgi:hypothetical protein
MQNADLQYLALRYHAQVIGGLRGVFEQGCDPSKSLTSRGILLALGYQICPQPPQNFKMSLGRRLITLRRFEQVKMPKFVFAADQHRELALDSVLDHICSNVAYSNSNSWLA